MNDTAQNEDHNPQVTEADRILETALQMAHEQDNWYAFSLMALAKRCDTSVNEIRCYYADSNAIANAWFGKALEAMLAVNPERLDAMPVTSRLELIIWRWFRALAPYHRVTTRMLGAKLHLPHIHHWVPMVFDLSRLVQLWRDAAGLHAGGRRQQLEEIVLTGVFLATLRAWCQDQGPQQAQAHSRLVELLTQSDRAARFLFLEARG